MSVSYNSQNDLLLKNLLEFYKRTNNFDNMINIINGNSDISLRIVDWFTTNYAKKYFTVYSTTQRNNTTRFKVYMDYKLQLKAYSKRRFDPFCRWDRISIPYGENGDFIQTTLGQLNFFKWAFENEIISYIRENYKEIEDDMNSRNSHSRSKERCEAQKPKHHTTQKKNSTNEPVSVVNIQTTNKTRRKRREELSISATKSVKRENVEIIVKFD